MGKAFYLVEEVHELLLELREEILQEWRQEMALERELIYQ